MTDVELKYNPYTNTTHIKVNEKPLDESEVTEYVGAGKNISDWAMNFWERISTKCNDDFTVHFCGLESDYIKLEQAFYTFKKSTTDNVCLEPDYVINPMQINDEKYVKDELDIIMGKKNVERPVLKECPECKHIILEESVYCPLCGKKQDGTERIDESRLYVEDYLKKTEIDNTIKDKLNPLYEALKKLFFIKLDSEKNTKKELDSHDSSLIENKSLPDEVLLKQLFSIYSSNPGDNVVFGKMTWKIITNHRDEAFLISTDDKSLVFKNLANKYDKIYKHNTLISYVRGDLYNYLNSDFLEKNFSAEERKFLKESKNNNYKIFIPTFKEVFQDRNAFSSHTVSANCLSPYQFRQYCLFQDGWISKHGNLVSYSDPNLNSDAHFIYAIIIDMSIFITEATRKLLESMGGQKNDN